VITWNVDFMAGHKAARTAVVLSYLSVLLPTPLSSTVLQEVTPRSHDAVLQCDQTECATPSVTDVTAPDKAVYFTLSLTTQDTPVSRVLRVRFSRTESQMCHDMLLLDVPTEVGPSGSGILTSSIRRIQARVCGRSITIAKVVSALQMGSEPLGALVAGDMNAIGPEDAEFPAVPGLRDVWEL